MDFYVDIAVAVLLRLMKDRRSVAQYFEELSKVHRKLDALYKESPTYAALYDQRAREEE